MRRLALLLPLLLACTEPHRGEVASTKYHRAYTYTTFILVNKTLVPQVHYVASRCEVVLTDGWECSIGPDCAGIWPGTLFNGECSAP